MAARQSQYRVILETQPKAKSLSERTLVHALEKHCATTVWALTLHKDSAIAFVTFRDASAVEQLLGSGTVDLNGVRLKVKPQILHREVDSQEETKLDELAQKPVISGAAKANGGSGGGGARGGIIVTETRDSSEVVPSGTDVSWSVQLHNRSTQHRELLSIEMPHATRLALTLVGRQPTAERPIRLAPGEKHSQQIKFSNRIAAAQGTFRHSVLFNFSNWLLEHEVTLRVAHASAISNLQLLQPEAPYVKPALPPDDAPPRQLVPALVGRQCALPGAALFAAVSTELEGGAAGGAAGGVVGGAALGAYELPADVAALVEGTRRPAGGALNPWKTRGNYRKRLHDLLHLEEVFGPLMASDGL